jgi:hypothetical protein
MQMTVNGTPHAPVRIQATTLLTQPAHTIPWTTLTNLVLPAGGSLQFLDRDAANAKARFYRVVSP